MRWPHTVVHVKNILPVHYYTTHPIALNSWEVVEYSPAKVFVIALTFVYILEWRRPTEMCALALRDPVWISLHLGSAYLESCTGDRDTSLIESSVSFIWSAPGKSSKYTQNILRNSNGESIISKLVQNIK